MIYVVSILMVFSPLAKYIFFEIKYFLNYKELTLKERRIKISLYKIRQKLRLINSHIKFDKIAAELGPVHFNDMVLWTVFEVILFFSWQFKMLEKRVRTHRVGRVPTK